MSDENATLTTDELRAQIAALHFELMRRRSVHRHAYPPQLNHAATVVHLREIVEWSKSEPNDSAIDHLGIYARRLVALPGWDPGGLFAINTPRGGDHDGMQFTFSARYVKSLPSEFRHCAACQQSIGSSAFEACPWPMERKDYIVGLAKLFGNVTDRWMHGDEAGGMAIVIDGAFPRLRAARQSNIKFRRVSEIDLPETWRTRTIPEVY